jgi:hypothetical protein
VYGYYILHKLRRFPHEWIDLPYHEKMAIFAFIDEKSRRDRLQEAKMKAQQKNTPKGRSRVRPARRR